MCIIALMEMVLPLPFEESGQYNAGRREEQEEENFWLRLGMEN